VGKPVKGNSVDTHLQEKQLAGCRERPTPSLRCGDVSAGSAGAPEQLRNHASALAQPAAPPPLLQNFLDFLFSQISHPFNFLFNCIFGLKVELFYHTIKPAVQISSQQCQHCRTLSNGRTPARVNPPGTLHGQRLPSPLIFLRSKQLS
jgi:hypothetical protein